MDTLWVILHIQHTALQYGHNLRINSLYENCCIFIQCVSHDQINNKEALA